MSSERERVREACMRAAREAYEDGGIRGLCGEGRFELAMDAIRALELDAPRSQGVRILGPEDARAFVALRLRALRDHPRAFLASEREDAALGVDGFAARLAQPIDRAFTLGGFVDGELAATAGVLRGQREKVEHRAMLWGVYVVPEQRGTGLGRAIVRRAIEQARAIGVEALTLSVDSANEPASALYRSLGFVAWGIEHDAFRADGEPVHEAHMVLSIR